MQKIGAHLQGLDGLRGIAILSVFLYHMYPDTFRGGYLGVILFFILSGYLTAISSEREWRSRKFHIWSYYKKRIKRIYPQLAAAVLAAAGAMAIVAPKLLEGIHGEIASIFLGYNNIWQILQNTSYFNRINNASPFLHIWSLAIEIQFYLIWPFLFLFYHYIRKRKRKDFCALVILIPLLVSVVLLEFFFNPAEDVSRVYYGTDTRIFSVLLGVFAGLKYRDARRRSLTAEKRKKSLIQFGLLSGLGCLMLVFMDGQWAGVYRFGMILFSFMACSVAGLAADYRLPVGKWLDFFPLQWLGKRSYEVYLLHYPILFLFRYTGWKGVPFFAVVVIVTLVLSVWVYELIHNGKKIWEKAEFLWMKVIYGAAVLLSVGFCVWGLYHIVTAKSADTAYQEQLQKKFEENQRALAQAEKKRQEQLAKAQAEQEEKSFVTAIGDSVLLGAAHALREEMPDCVINAKESRQVTEGLEIIREMEQNKSLGDTVVIALGTNGPFTLAEGQEIINALSGREIYWVTVYGDYLQWQDEVNQNIYTLQERNPQMQIIDWASEVAYHGEWLYEDGIHPNPQGEVYYASLIADSVKDDVEENTEEAVEGNAEGNTEESVEGNMEENTEESVEGNAEENTEESVEENTEEVIQQ